MLLYVMVIIGLLTALFSWQTYDDATYQDAGEQTAATRMLQVHNLELALCTFPNGMYAPQAYTNNAYENGVANGTVVNYQYQDRITYPINTAAYSCDSSQGPIAAPPATSIAGMIPKYATTPKGDWQGFRTIIQNNYVITVAITGSDSSNEASTNKGLSIARIGARLLEGAQRSPIGSTYSLGTYEKSSGKVRMNRGVGSYLSASTDALQAGFALDTDILVSGIADGIPNGAPVIASLLPAPGTTFGPSGSQADLNGSTGSGPASTQPSAGDTPPPFITVE